MFRVTVPLFTIPALIQSYIKYFSTGSADTSFRLAFDATLPYNWKTPTTYLLTMLVQIVSFANSAAIYAISFIMFFGVCTYLVALNDDFKQSVSLLDDQIRCSSFRTKAKLRKQFHDLIQFHAEAKELSFKSCEFILTTPLKSFSFFFSRLGYLCSGAYGALTTILLLNSVLVCSDLLLETHFVMLTAL